MSPVYLDYAATTPVDKEALKAMLPFFAKKFGNASSLHSFGRVAKGVLEESRKSLAKIINSASSEIIFTSSATEANNLALKGAALANLKEKNHIIVSAIEHESVLETARWLEKQGVTVTYLPVDKFGQINPKDVENAITKKTILVSVMHASNEIGTIQPIQEIAAICRQNGVYFHTDASQTFGKLAIDVKKLGIDLLTASSHKIYGPKGAGFLYIRRGILLAPVLHGGGQEYGLRSSTVNVPAVAGFAKAAEVTFEKMDREEKRITALRDNLISDLLAIEGSHLTGHPDNRLSNNIHVWLEGIDGEQLAARLDVKGFCVSSASACSATSLEPSHVLLALGLSREQAKGALRISLGRATTKGQLVKCAKILAKTVQNMRLT